jgi:hypothetical protein
VGRWEEGRREKEALVRKVREVKKRRRDKEA